MIDIIQGSKEYHEVEREIWDFLVYRDIVAFCTSDWEMIADCFINNEFHGIQCYKTNDKSKWKLQYSTIESYKEDWLRESIKFSSLSFLEDPVNVLLETTKLSKLEIEGNKALVQKDFNAKLTTVEGSSVVFEWTSLFVLRKVNETWKILSFVGYMLKH